MLKRIWEWIKGLFKSETKTMTFDFAPEIRARSWNSPKLAKLVRKTAGGHHAWYETTDGRLVRKPIQNLN